LCRRTDQVVSLLDFSVLSRATRHSVDHTLSTLGTNLHDEIVFTVQHFADRQIESDAGAWARPNGRAETRPASMGAIDRDNESLVPDSQIGRILIRTTTKDLILNLDGTQVTGSHAEECILLCAI
jgi:hypothetical protein